MPWLRDDTRNARRQGFIDAAGRCARESGLRDVSLDAICAEAGVTKGAFYAHFTSKQELVEAVIDHDDDEVERLIAHLEAGPHSPVERIRQLTKALLDRAADTGRMRIRADLWAMVLNEPAMRARADQAAQRHRRVLRRWIEAAVADGELAPIPANALASVLLALADGLVLHYTINPNGFRWTNVGRAIEAILAGLGT